MEEHTLLVWAMNGKPLANIHGGPLRLVDPGLAGLGLAQVADQDHAARQGARRPGHERHLLPRRRSSRWCPAARPTTTTSRSWNRCRCAASSPARPNGTELAAGTTQAQAARRGLGRRPRGRSGRRVDRLRRHLAAGQARAADEPLRLAALDGDASTCRATATTRSGSRATDSNGQRSRMSPATGTRRATAQPDAPHRRAGRSSEAAHARARRRRLADDGVPAVASDRRASLRADRPMLTAAGEGRGAPAARSIPTRASRRRTTTRSRTCPKARAARSPSTPAPPAMAWR